MWAMLSTLARMDARGGRRSRCFTPSNPPLELLWFLDEQSGADTLGEVKAELANHPPVESAMRRAEIRDRLSKAAAGELADYDDNFFEPVWSQPRLWEHKWKRLGYRLYHGEPEGFHLVVLLRFHIKWTGGSPAEIKGAQQDEMRVAAERHEAGRSFRWRRTVEG